MYTQNTHQNKGFTFIEVMVTLALVAIVAGLTMASFSSLNNRQVLDKEVDNIKSIIQKTRLESLNSKNAASHGLTFASTTVTTIASGTTTSKIYTFSAGVVLEINGLKQVSNGSATTSVSFAKISGSANATGTLTYVFKSGSTNMATRTVTINALGTAE